MKCPKCGSDVANGFKFCLNCGSPVERQAPAAQQQDDPELLKKINQIQKAAREAIQPSGGTEQEEPDRLDILAAGMASGEDKAPAAAGSAAEEHEPPRRSRRITPAAEPEKSEPVQAPAAPAAPEPVRAPAAPTPPQAPAAPSGNGTGARYSPPVRKNPDRSAARAASEKNYRPAGRGVMFWILLLLLVLIAVYVGACILIPDHALTAPAVNLATTVWNYLSASWKDMLWFLIALGAIIVLAILKAVLGAPLRRKIHARDTEEARDLAGRVVVVETLAPPHQVHAELDEIVKNRKTRKQYFPAGKVTLDEFASSGVPLEYSAGNDSFTANFVFQRMERTGTRIFLEIIRWQLDNGVVSGRCVRAMQGLEPMLRDAVLDIDSNAKIQIYDR